MIKFANVVKVKTARINPAVKSKSLILFFFSYYFFLISCSSASSTNKSQGCDASNAIRGRERSRQSADFGPLPRRFSSLVSPTPTLSRSSPRASLSFLRAEKERRGEDRGAGSPQSERRYLKHMQRVQSPLQGERGKKSRTMATCVRLLRIRLTTIYATSATVLLLVLPLFLFLFLLSSHSHLSFVLPAPIFSFDPCLRDRRSREREKEARIL